MKRIVISTAVLALACAGLGQAQAAPSVYKVTGGGQITSVPNADGSEGTTPTRNTIAFTAQAATTDGEPAKGQVQYIDREAGNGQDQVRSHGRVTCVVVQQAGVDEEGMATPAMARLEGVLTKSDQTVETFTIDVVDNGQGSMAEMDMVAFRYGGAADADDDGDTSCDLEDDFNADGGLGNGNVKIHKDKAAPAGSGSETEGKGGKGGGKPAFALR